jgi:hypothetical protein
MTFFCNTEGKPKELFEKIANARESWRNLRLSLALSSPEISISITPEIQKFVIDYHTIVTQMLIYTAKTSLQGRAHNTT